MMKKIDQVIKDCKEKRYSVERIVNILEYLTKEQKETLERIAYHISEYNGVLNVHIPYDMDKYKVVRSIFSDLCSIELNTACDSPEQWRSLGDEYDEIVVIYMNPRSTQSTCHRVKAGEHEVLQKINIYKWECK